MVLPVHVYHRFNNHNLSLHSHNLLALFPHPGSLPKSSIDEDGNPEIQIGLMDEES